VMRDFYDPNDVLTEFGMFDPIEDEPIVSLLARLAQDGRLIEFEPVGSRETCDPAPIGTDWDFLCFVKDFYGTIADLKEIGFDDEGSEICDEDGEEHIDMRFVSMKRGIVNLIVTDKRLFYDRFLAATSVAKRLNLLKKEDRIALFQAVLYGNISTVVRSEGK
jgi:hypothetical protein